MEPSGVNAKRKLLDFTIEELADISKEPIGKKPYSDGKKPEKMADAFKMMKKDLKEAYRFWDQELHEQEISDMQSTIIESVRETGMKLQPERQQTRLGPLTLSRLKEKKDAEQPPENKGASQA